VRSEKEGERKADTDVSADKREAKEYEGGEQGGVKAPR
jgi:hypothetical protein